MNWDTNPSTTAYNQTSQGKSGGGRPQGTLLRASGTPVGSSDLPLLTTTPNHADSLLETVALAGGIPLTKYTETCADLFEDSTADSEAGG